MELPAPVPYLQKSFSCNILGHGLIVRNAKGIAAKGRIEQGKKLAECRFTSAFQFLEQRAVAAKIIFIHGRPIDQARASMIFEDSQSYMKAFSLWQQIAFLLLRYKKRQRR